MRQAKQNFLVAVRTVDNTFSYPLPVGAVIKLSPFIYWDKNNNGIYDSADVRLEQFSEFDGSEWSQAAISNGQYTADH